MFGSRILFQSWAHSLADAVILASQKFPQKEKKHGTSYPSYGPMVLNELKFSSLNDNLVHICIYRPLKCDAGIPPKSNLSQIVQNYTSIIEQAGS